MDASPAEAEILLVGGQPIDLQDFPKLKGIFKCGVGRDNVPEDHANQRGLSADSPPLPRHQLFSMKRHVLPPTWFCNACMLKVAALIFGRK